MSSSSHFEKRRWPGSGRAPDFLGAMLSWRGGGSTVLGRCGEPGISAFSAGVGNEAGAGAAAEEEDVLRRRIPFEDKEPSGEPREDAGAEDDAEEEEEEADEEEEEERRRRPERLSSEAFPWERLSPERLIRSIISSRETGSTSASGKASGLMPASRGPGRNAPEAPDSRSADGN